ncbi:MAG TPA: hypothetical protein DCG06_07050 [Deltaproteobacteria bacterium]|nr:hypothetical protein [Deltaproteobacteria bacterium]
MGPKARPELNEEKKKMKSLKTGKSFRFAVAMMAAGSLAMAGAAQADEVVPGEAVIVGEEIVVVEEGCADCPVGNNGFITIAGGVDLYDKYFFRGLTQQTAGLQAQPWAEIAIQLVDNGEGPFQNVSFFVGTWASLNSKDLGFGNLDATQNPAPLYELDLYVGVSASLGAGFTASVSYVNYLYPNNGFSTIQELDLGISFDDSEHLGAFALSPYALFAFEVAGGSSGINGNKNGSYLEIGAEPGYTFNEDGSTPITVSAPISMGMAIGEDYVYGGNTVGFASLGLAGSAPLSFVPAGYGDWSVWTGITGIWQAAAIRTGGSDWKPNFGAGISMEY